MKDFLLAQAIKLQFFIREAWGATGPNESDTSFDLKTLNPFSGVSTIPDILAKILDFLVTLSYPIVAIMIMWGAFLILTAGGKPENLSKGKSVIMWAIIGFVIVLMASGATALLRDILFSCDPNVSQGGGCQGPVQPR